MANRASCVPQVAAAQGQVLAANAAQAEGMARMTTELIHLAEACSCAAASLQAAQASLAGTQLMCSESPECP